MGDVDGDGHPELITGAGQGGGPNVRVFSFNPTTGAVSMLANFFPYDPGFGGGVFVAAGVLDGDGVDEVITGAGPGGGPHVSAFAGPGVSPAASFFAYDAGFAGGVAVAGGDLGGNGAAKIVTGAGPGGGPHVRVFDAAGAPTAISFFPYDPGFAGG